jgi:inositol-phosphate phosphatase / L-galactose 1-phosphate phosphatase / histidinol-phosphatase
MQTLGNETLKNDPDFATNDLRCLHVARLTALLEAQLSTRLTADWLEIFNAAKLPCGPINTVGQAISQPQVRARTMLVQTGFEDGSPLSVAGNPMKFSAHADLDVRTKAPRLDEHRASILQGLHHKAALSDAWVRFAQTLADKSGIIARHYFRKSMDYSDKNDASPVTIADREIEEALRLMIRTAYPEHGICGEEFGPEQAGAVWQWVIDPIDGTRAFLAGRPTFATLIALLKDGVPVLGVIDQPIVGDRWLGVSGAATRHNGVVCQSNAQATLAQARLSTTGPNYFNAQEAACYERLRAAIGMSLWGGDGYAYGLLASGYSDIIVEAGLKCHDFAALVPIVAGAGGAMVDWQGQPLHAQSRGQVIAVGNKALLEDILPIFANK